MPDSKTNSQCVATLLCVVLRLANRISFKVLKSADFNPSHKFCLPQQTSRIVPDNFEFDRFRPVCSLLVVLVRRSPVSTINISTTSTIHMFVLFVLHKFICSLSFNRSLRYALHAADSSYLPYFLMFDKRLMTCVRETRIFQILTISLTDESSESSDSSDPSGLIRQIRSRSSLSHLSFRLVSLSSLPILSDSSSFCSKSSCSFIFLHFFFYLSDENFEFETLRVSLLV